MHTAGGSIEWESSGQKSSFLPLSLGQACSLQKKKKEKKRPDLNYIQFKPNIKIDPSALCPAFTFVKKGQERLDLQTDERWTPLSKGSTPKWGHRKESAAQNPLPL